MNKRQLKKRNKQLYYIGIADAFHSMKVIPYGQVFTLTPTKVALGFNQHGYGKYVKFGKFILKYLSVK